MTKLSWGRVDGGGLRDWGAYTIDRSQRLRKILLSLRTMTDASALRKFSPQLSNCSSAEALRVATVAPKC